MSGKRDKIPSERVMTAFIELLRPPTRNMSTSNPPPGLQTGESTMMKFVPPAIQ